jgi:hypothetical protein
LAGYGPGVKKIAAVIGCTVPELKKFYERELELGDAQADANLGRSLFEQAVGRDAVLHPETGNVIRPALAPNPSVAIFMGKARLGLRETPQAVELSGPGGGPIEISGLDLSALDDEELVTFRTLIAKARARSPAKAKAR